jgi:hypothetical protein
LWTASQVMRRNDWLTTIENIIYFNIFYLFFLF